MNDSGLVGWGMTGLLEEHQAGELLTTEVGIHLVGYICLED